MLSEKTMIPCNSGHSKRYFIRPIKQVYLDFLFFSCINASALYLFFFFIPDSTAAMISSIWVGIIAWREGVLAGLIASFLALFLNYLVINIPPHSINSIALHFYFDNHLPGFIIGLIQTMIIGLSIGYISELVHTLRGEINLRKSIQKELEQKVSELDKFAHTVAHDLRNPLFIVKNSIENLLDDQNEHENPDFVSKLLFIKKSTKQMAEIIQSILLLAGINSTRQAEKSKFPMKRSVDNALQRLKTLFESNSITIKKPDEWPEVVAYPPWITEVWVNYINNAIMYGGNPRHNIKPEIELGFDKPICSTASGKYRFWVRDNGSGIPSSEITKLFTEFSRLHTNENGCGLGLSIVKSIITKSDGEVGVESEIGKGSLFYFTLPAG